MVGMKKRYEGGCKFLVGGVLCVFAAALVGCGDAPADYPETAAVSGVVTLDGKPLEGARVVFTPPVGRSSAGQTDAEGRYSVMYTGTVAGAMLGKHRVSIFKEGVTKQQLAGAEGDDDTDPPVNLLPTRYGGPTSELQATVEAGRNVFDFQLTSSE